VNNSITKKECLCLNTIHNLDCLEGIKQLPSNFVDCCVTSPPYWGLRDYGIEPCVWGGDSDCQHIFDLNEIQTGRSHWNSGGKVIPYEERKIRNGAKREFGFCHKCGAWCGSLGLEPTFDLFIENLCDIFDEVKRILKNEGTCWVNLGDTYSGSCQGASKNTRERIENKKTENLGSSLTYLKKYGHTLTGKPPSAKTSVPNKSLCMIPFRFAIEMVDRGWILRNTIIWHKPNCMPASVKDRFTVDFEYLFFFVKSKKYWFERQYEPHITGRGVKFNLRVRDVKRGYSTKSGQYRATAKEIEQYHGQQINYGSQGRNKRCVWRIVTQPFSGAHFAVYPERLIETPIKAGCPEKGVVLDPFMGSGTTAVVARKLGRNFIGFEKNPDYCKISNKRMLDLK
jgi:site-specific DNA-methyltransferase (adenine-specific)